MNAVVRSAIQSTHPRYVVPGGRLVVRGTGFDVRPGHVPAVTFGGAPAHVRHASSRQIVIEVPADVQGGSRQLAIEGLEGATPLVTVGEVLATGVHQVDSPVFDVEGRVYATLSGQRGQQTPVAVFRIGPSGARDPFVTGIANPTSLVFGPDGHLYVSSRFQGTVWRVSPEGIVETYAEGLGAAFGLAFNRAGDLFVGDRSGTIHKVDGERTVTTFATLPPSMAAYHLAIGADDEIVVAAPTLNSSDVLYRVSPDGEARTWLDGFGRPQGLAYDRYGTLHVVDALAGDSGVYRIAADGTRELVVSGDGLIGVTFDPTDNAMAVCSDDTIYRFPATGF